MKTKVSILSAVIAAAVSASAVAEIQPLAADQFTLGGEAAVGGYYFDKESDAVKLTDGATALTLYTHYKNGPLVGYVELDIQAQYGDEMEDDIESDLDKAWLGYDFGYGVVSYGMENDTALDKVDGAGDMTFEFGMSAPDASDAFDVIKVQGQAGSIAYGVSYFETADETDANKAGDDRGYNGYVGFVGEKFAVYAGYEERGNEDFTGVNKGDKETVTSFSGNVDLGVVRLGANVWSADLHNANGKNQVETVDGYYVSASKGFGALTLAAGYGDIEGDVNVTSADVRNDISVKGEADNFDGSFNVSAHYVMSSNTYVGVDVRNQMFKEGDDEMGVYLKAGYTF